MSNKKQNIKQNLIDPKETEGQIDCLVIPPKNSFILGDCMDYLKLFPPNFFDLAIVDPPYGIGADIAQNNNKGKQGYKLYKESNWDISPPPPKYFRELKRISKNQIIFGGNYFVKQLDATMGWVVWDKVQRLTVSDCELIYTSFNVATRIFTDARGNNQGFMNPDRFHPTQKPIKIYKYLLKQFAKAGDLILDTRVGSASSLIACTELGFDYIGFEKDEEYYTMAKSRLGRATRKYELFEAV